MNPEETGEITNFKEASVCLPLADFEFLREQMKKVDKYYSVTNKIIDLRDFVFDLKDIKETDKTTILYVLEEILKI